VSVAPDNVVMRRLLRPLGWTVWHALLEHAEDVDGTLVAAVSVRSLADELGLAKDTVAAAIRRLVAHGLVTRQLQARHDTRFTAGAYVRHPTAATPPMPRPTSSAARPSAPSGAADSPSANAVSQLSLLDEVADSPSPALFGRRTCISDAGHARGTGAAPC